MKSRERIKVILNRAWHILYPILLFFFTTTIVGLLLTFVVEYLVKGFVINNINISNYSLQMAAIINGIAMCFGGGVLVSECVSEVRRRGNSPVQLKTYVVIVITTALIALLLNVALSYLDIASHSENYDEIANIQFSVSYPIGIVLYGIVAPTVEEILFRGIIYNRLRSYMNIKLAIIISSVLFGIYHGNIVQAVYATVLGMLMAIAYERYSSFKVPLIMHASANICIYSIAMLGRIV